MNDKNRRRAPRSRHNSVIEILDAGGKVAVFGRLVDFSTLGASFAVGDSVVIPKNFRARLRLLNEGVFEAQVRVVWVRREKNAMRYGIYFYALTLLRPSGGNG
ncbi:MAG TPA: hypothetical protein DCL44_03130 [Elusimicrobia bacterium]|nr:hypothetical protein [Elusimicrobiota bacterium]